MNIQRDIKNNQFWTCRIFNDGIVTRLVPAYIGGGRKLHAVDEPSFVDGRGTAMCGRTGWLARGTVLDGDAICASCKRILEAGP